jgi:BirA family biotin operon repressor/biotin-[acetyl-CoA-carboxylase] ligase
MADHDFPVLPPGYRLIAREAVGSTNDEARALIAAGAAKGAVVWAESQTAGRGRHGREWVSPPGNLYCSTIIRADVEPARLGEFSFVAALATRDAVTAVVPAEIPVELKWPNDVLVQGKKAAGVLVEAEKLPDERRTALIVGIGVNIVSAPREASYPATCLSAVVRPPRPGRLLELLVAALDRRAAIREEWMRHAYRVGEQIAVGDVVTGVFAGVDETGALIVAATDGGRRRLVSGSVRYL